MLTDEQKIHVIKIWHSTKSLTAVRRAFRKIPGFHSKNLPSISSLQKIVEKFSTHGTVKDLRKGKKIPAEESSVKKVATLYQKNQRLSLRTASRRLRLSKRKVARILRRKLLKRAYKAKVRMMLTERQRKDRKVSCQRLLSMHHILPKVWFSDESWFFSDGIAQKKCQYYWAMDRDSVLPIESQLVPVKVMVWGAVSTKGLIGPYIFHKNGAHISVNQQSYADCLSWFVARLKEKMLLKSAWFMQDGAPSHTARSIRTVIGENFPDCLIGKHLSVHWPPYSPDLTPADFWLWPTLKRIIFSGRTEPFTNIASLKRAITWGFRKLRSRNLSLLASAVERRLKHCIEKEGFRT